jgi:hypothetical protein
MPASKINRFRLLAFGEDHQRSTLRYIGSLANCMT